MNIQSLLQEHGVARNPFTEEDAQTDPVFKEHCIVSAYHPVWDKVYGDPSEPSTAIVFGPKGSGKTAMRLQIAQHLEAHNRQNPSEKVFVIQYDDFNPFLEHFTSRLRRKYRSEPQKHAERILDRWRLWDHMDCILCLGTTQLIDAIIEEQAPTRRRRGAELQIDAETAGQLDRTTARDLLLLACCYDQSTASTFTGRWNRFRNKLGFSNWSVKWDLWLGIAVTVLVLLLSIYLVRSDRIGMQTFAWLFPGLSAIGWVPYAWRWLRCHWLARGIRKHMRVGKRELGSLQKVLMQFPPKELASQPLPRFDRTDDRYELLAKFQTALRRLDFTGLIVLVDRVDEPHLTGGRPERMQRLVWPLLDNKLLKHPGLGLKMMLPQELYRNIEREDNAFQQRARMDKQNVIPSFAWTGESLYDLAKARMLACAIDGKHPDPRELFEDTIPYERMLAVFQSLRVPRHLFRFLYRVLVEHCNQYSDADPHYRVEQQTFESVLAVYQRDMESTGG